MKCEKNMHITLPFPIQNIMELHSMESKRIFYLDHLISVSIFPFPCLLKQLTHCMKSIAVTNNIKRLLCSKPASVHNARTLTLQQLNGIQQSIFYLCISHCDIPKCFLRKGTMGQTHWTLFEEEASHRQSCYHFLSYPLAPWSHDNNQVRHGDPLVQGKAMPFCETVETTRNDDRILFKNSTNNSKTTKGQYAIE